MHTPLATSLALPIHSHTTAYLASAFAAAFAAACAAASTLFADAITSPISTTFLFARTCVPNRFFANFHAFFVGLLPPPRKISIRRFSYGA